MFAVLENGRFFIFIIKCIKKKKIIFYISRLYILCLLFWKMADFGFL